MRLGTRLVLVGRDTGATQEYLFPECERVPVAALEHRRCRVGSCGDGSVEVALIAIALEPAAHSRVVAASRQRALGRSRRTSR